VPTAIPIGDKLRVEVLPQEERSKILVTASRETPLRRCRITALGPDANQKKSPKLSVGMVVLCNILTAQQFGEELILPSNAVVATMD
jgi:co-chaperonin GroES (HSP10)